VLGTKCNAVGTAVFVRGTSQNCLQPLWSIGSIASEPAVRQGTWQNWREIYNGLVSPFVSLIGPIKVKSVFYQDATTAKITTHRRRDENWIELGQTAVCLVPCQSLDQ
jgi:hypothetical protein